MTGRTLKKIRGDMTQEEFAKYLSSIPSVIPISRSSLANWEAGVQEIPAYIKVLIKKADERKKNEKSNKGGNKR